LFAIYLFYYGRKAYAAPIHIAPAFSGCNSLDGAAFSFAENGEKEFLRTIWYPAVGNFDHLYPEWEVRDFANGYRYLDLAYMPGDAKGMLEIQGYGPHARDIDAWRFKDLCFDTVISL
jgi:hypothetical protein